MGTITLSDRQQRRAEVLARVCAGVVSVHRASELLGVTERHVRRLVGRYRKEGMACVVHGNSGRVPANRTPAALQGRLAELAGPEGVYHDFNTAHLHEMLSEREGVRVGRSTLDRLLVKNGVRKRRRSRPRRVFRNRERCARQGEMLLTDGSLHDWLEARDPRHRKLCLLGCIDDATGTVLHLRFWPTECQAGYIQMLREVTVSHGIPMSYYHDRHTILCSPKEPTIDDELAGREPMSQFQAILAQLGVEAIKATTPQAKGRIERLWGTLQDRLVREMRLADISTLDDANAFLAPFLARFNKRFSVAAREHDTAWVQADDLDLPFYFAAKEERVVRRDHTIPWMGATLHIQRKHGQRSLAGTRVKVHTTPEGQCFVYDGTRRLTCTAVAQRPKPVVPTTSSAAQTNRRPQLCTDNTNKPKASDNAGRRAWLYAPA